MKILYDFQIFQNQTFGGISRYIYELMTRLKKLDDVDVDLAVKYSDNIFLKREVNILPYPKLERNFAYRYFSQKKFIGSKRFSNIIAKVCGDKKRRDFAYNFNRELSLKKIREGNFDVFHATFYDDYFLEAIGNKPFVLTVHDLIFQIYPEYFSLCIDKPRQLIDRAKQIIVVSKNTKRDLMSYYDVPEEKIDVVYLASSLNLETCEKTGKPTFLIPNRYVLFVGHRGLYKNFYFFVEAFAKIQKDYPDLFLICSGPSFTEEELLFFKKIGINNYIKQFFVTDNELAYLYQNAAFFIFPSLYEGFGIPILEAFENNCPVLAAKSSSLIEIGEDAVIFFEPKNINSLIFSMKKLLDDQLLCTKLITKGKEKILKYSWELVAKETLAVYKKALC